MRDAPTTFRLTARWPACAVVGARASRRALVLSRGRGAVLDDAAAGERGALAITYTAPRPTAARPLLYATFAAVPFLASRRVAVAAAVGPAAPAP